MFIVIYFTTPTYWLAEFKRGQDEPNEVTTPGMVKKIHKMYWMTDKTRRLQNEKKSSMYVHERSGRENIIW